MASARRLWPWAALLSAAFCPDGAAQDLPTGETEWKAYWRTRAGLKLTDNVFQISPKSLDLLEQDRPNEELSGRFDGMERVEDAILLSTLRFGARGPSPFGRTIDASADVEVEANLLNTVRSRFEFEARAIQEVEPRSTLGLFLRYLPQYFHRNSLFSFVDANFNGSVSSSDRRYAEEVYDEFEVTAAHRRLLIEPSEESPVSVEAIVAAGFRGRDYRAPFGGRDEVSWMVRPSAEVAWDDRVHLQVTYVYARHDNDPHLQLQLFDEPEFGTDFNMDLDVVDQNVPVYSLVNRSHVRHEASVELRGSPWPAFEIGVDYGLRLKRYSSIEAFDVSHSGRTDTREQAGAWASWASGRGWTLRLGFEYEKQRTDRVNDPDSPGERIDYRSRTLMISVSKTW